MPSHERGTGFNSNVSSAAAYTGASMMRCRKTEWGDYIWLAYSVFLFIEPIVRNDARYWLETLALFAAFLPLYLLLVRVESKRQQAMLLAAMVVLGVVGFRFNMGATCFFIFAAAFLPFTGLSTPTVIACLLAEEIILAAEGLLVRSEWINTGIALLLVAVLGTGNLFIAQRKKANARLERAQDEIERLAALAERERIARDMHDVLGHTLSVIVLKAELARRLLEQHGHLPAGAPEIALATAEIAEVEQTARTALAEVRKAIVGYRAEGLAAELDLARRTLRSAGVELTVHASADASFSALSATEETVLSLALREAVTNIVRHAQATVCQVHLFPADDGFHSLVVEDNGRGGVLREGNGLRGMRERVEGLGGRFRVAAGARELTGTALTIELPARVPARTHAPLPAAATEPEAVRA